MRLCGCSTDHEPAELPEPPAGAIRRADATAETTTVPTRTPGTAEVDGR